MLTQQTETAFDASPASGAAWWIKRGARWGRNMARRFQALCVFVSIAAGTGLPCSYLSAGQARAPDLEQPKGPVTLATPRSDYLLGEPVLLDVGFKNLTQQELRHREPVAKDVEPDIEVYISGNGREFERCLMCGAIAKRVPRYVTLKPGEAISYRLRVLRNARTGFQSISPRRASALAIERPGEYFLKVLYPTFSVQGPSHIESNVVAVRVKEPTGLDAKVWQRLQEMNRPEKPMNVDAELWERIQHRYGVFAGIQSDSGPSVEHAKNLIGILWESPKTSYAEAFRSALRRFYFSQRLQVSLEERARIRQLTGVTDVHEFKDQRLDAKVEMGFDRAKIKVHDTWISLSLETLLETLREQTRIPFEASPDLKRRTISLFTPPVNAREAMDSDWVTDRLNAWWVKRGDGYVLIREEDLESPANKSAK